MIDQFLITYLPLLSEELILKVLGFIPETYVHELFVRHPSRFVSDIAFAASFGKKTRLNPTVPDTAPFMSMMNGIWGIDDCMRFCRLFRRRPIRQIKLCFYKDYSPMSQIVDAINGMDVYQVKVYLMSEKYEKCRLRIKHLKSLCALRPLTKISFFQVRLSNKTSFFSSSAFKSHPRIRLLKFDDCGIHDWLAVSWPPNAAKLLCQAEKSGTELALPPKVEKLKLLDFPDSFEAIAKLTRMSNASSVLRGLTVQYLEPCTLQLLSLPSSLEVLDFLLDIDNIAGSSWPPMLKRLSFRDSNLNSAVLEGIELIPWPSTLESLTFSKNQIEMFTGALNTLPDTLQELDLGEPDLQLYEENDLNSSYVNFRLPVYLKTLKILDLNSSLAKEGDQRVVLPRHLEYLKISNCMIEQLNFVSIPSSIKEIELINCGMRNLENYDEEEDDYTGLGSPKWSKLVNLEKLNVLNNFIWSLENWNPPANLRELDLTGNLILPVFPPELNSLSTLKTTLTATFLLREVRLPQRLRTWQSDVQVAEFLVPELICNHPTLYRWSLNKLFDLRKIKFPRQIQGNLALQMFDMLNGAPEYMGEPLYKRLRHVLTAQFLTQFYDDLERVFGRTLLRRPSQVMCIHILRKKTSDKQVDISKRRVADLGEQVPSLKRRLVDSEAAQ